MLHGVSVQVYLYNHIFVVDIQRQNKKRGKAQLDYLLSYSSGLLISYELPSWMSSAG